MILRTNRGDSRRWAMAPVRLSRAASFIAVACVLAFVSNGWAQIEGSIRVISDSQEECTLLDSGPGVRTISVVHAFNAGATASRFRIVPGPGVTMTYLSEVHPFSMTAGNTQSGISVCYGQCAAGDLLLATIDYMAYGTSASCSQILVVPHAAAQTVEAILCDGTPVRTFVQDMFIQRVVGDCGCPEARGIQGTPQVFTCSPVAVETATWGAIKAFYR